jgi:nucleotide-binding universal stress UspA family protein
LQPPIDASIGAAPRVDPWRIGADHQLLLAEDLRGPGSLGRAYSQKELDALVAKAKKAGVRATAMLLDGTAHQRIVRVARSKRADLIVIGTHGRTGLARLFLGSVAGRVVATATCPVMTVLGK